MKEKRNGHYKLRDVKTVVQVTVRSCRIGILTSLRWSLDSYKNGNFLPSSKLFPKIVAYSIY